MNFSLNLRKINFASARGPSRFCDCYRAMTIYFNQGFIPYRSSEEKQLTVSCGEIPGKICVKQIKEDLVAHGSVHRMRCDMVLWNANGPRIKKVKLLGFGELPNYRPDDRGGVTTIYVKSTIQKPKPMYRTSMLRQSPSKQLETMQLVYVYKVHNRRSAPSGTGYYAGRQRANYLGGRPKLQGNKLEH